MAKKATERATCSRCGLSRDYPAASPAAPKLSALEAAGKDGWTFCVDFQAMLTGNYREVCPSCKGGKS